MRPQSPDRQPSEYLPGVLSGRKTPGVQPPQRLRHKRHFVCASGRTRIAALSVLVATVIVVGAQEINEAVPPGEGRFLIMASRGSGFRDGMLRRDVTFRMLASDGTRLKATLPEVKSFTIPFRTESFIDWTLQIRDRLRLILNDQGYTVERRNIYDHDTSSDILAIEAIEITPPADVSILLIDFDVRTPPTALAPAVEHEVYLEYQSFVTPDPDLTANLDWNLLSYPGN